MLIWREVNLFVKKVPKWLKKLPPGQYTVNEVSKITGGTYANICQRFKVLELPRHPIKLGNFKLIKYEWIGFEQYEKQNKEDLNGK